MGTSLSDVFENFGAPVNFQANSSPSIYSFLATPSIPLRDASGTALFRVTQESLRASLTENLPTLDINATQMQSAIDDFRNLKNHSKYLSDELAVFKKNCNTLEEIQQKSRVIIEDYTNEVLRMGILTTEEFTILQEKTKEIRELQATAAKKCLDSYIHQIIDLEGKLRTVTTNLSAYQDFIKEGTKGLLGKEVKPNTCSICLEKELSHCLVPCGHTFCEDCINKSGAGAMNTVVNCMTCRTPVSNSIKFFL